MQWGFRKSVHHNDKLVEGNAKYLNNPYMLNENADHKVSLTRPRSATNVSSNPCPYMRRERLGRDMEHHHCGRCQGDH